MVDNVIGEKGKGTLVESLLCARHWAMHFKVPFPFIFHHNLERQMMLSMLCRWRNGDSEEWGDLPRFPNVSDVGRGSSPGHSEPHLHLATRREELWSVGNGCV